jgi:hypothetical protein
LEEGDVIGNLELAAGVRHTWPCVLQELILSGANTYGGTLVDVGTLTVTNPATLPLDGNLTVSAEAQTTAGPTAVLDSSALTLLGFATN